MRLIKETTDISLKGITIALGYFDGVHIGHKKLIEEIVYSAKKHNTSSCVWSFSNRPENILKDNFDIKNITTIEDKAEIFQDLGVDIFFIEDFTKVKDLSPIEFIENILIKKFSPRLIVCGFNFRFGKNGLGDAQLLKDYFKNTETKVKIISPISVENTVVNSTGIRKLIENGDMETAALHLGHQFFINLTVDKGNKIGTKIGFPTINQKIPINHIVPQKGVYAVSCYINDEPYLGVCNIGNKPTLSNSEALTSETHILNFNQKLYGEKSGLQPCSSGAFLLSPDFCHCSCPLFGKKDRQNGF